MSSILAKHALALFDPAILAAAPWTSVKKLGPQHLVVSVVFVGRVVAALVNFFGRVAG